MVTEDYFVFVGTKILIGGQNVTEHARDSFHVQARNENKTEPSVRSRQKWENGERVFALGQRERD